ncbi:hypothetical protein BDR04DRAFT_1100365 [Suillus decipiens]|nr:hypothetical protein BDR04DRAFT_1100365 [Suillus decipiens]
MVVSLVGRNPHTQACVPQSVVDSITCNIQQAHPLLPIMFLRYHIMHPTIHSIIRFFSQSSYTCASSFKCTSFFTLVTLLILTHGRIISSIALAAHFYRFIQIVSGAIAST